MSLEIGVNMITDEVILEKKVHPSLTKYKFTNLDLAHRIRAHVMKLIARFDKNSNFIFEESEVIDIMQTLLKETEIEVYYVISNVFRYDRDGDNRVTYS